MAFTLSLCTSAFASCMMMQFDYGLKTGGSAAMVWGWLIIGVFLIFEALAISEICSSYPAEGGTYYWTGVLAPPKYKPILSYLVGWTYLSTYFFGPPALVSSISSILSGLNEYFTGTAWSASTNVGLSIFILGLIAAKGFLRIDHQGYFHDFAAIL